MNIARIHGSNLSPVFAILFIAIFSISTRTLAQNTFKCGNVYSATPCPGGMAIDTQDNRTSAQKTQAEAATAKAAKAGDAMEKSRLTQEKLEAKERASAAGSGASAMSAKNSTADAVNQPTKSNVANKKKKEPEFFTAQVPGEQKVKAKAQKEAHKVTKKAGKAKKLEAAASANGKP